MTTQNKFTEAALNSFLYSIEDLEEDGWGLRIYGLRAYFINKTFAALVASPEFALLNSEERRKVAEDQQWLNKLLEAVEKFADVYLGCLDDRTLVAQS